MAATINSTIKRRKRERAFRRGGGLCCYCGIPLSLHGPTRANYATLEHVLPKAEGGGNEDRNLKIACLECNNLRGRENDYFRYFRSLTAQRIEARSDETVQPAQPEGREPDGKADAPKT